MADFDSITKATRDFMQRHGRSSEMDHLLSEMRELEKQLNIAIKGNNPKAISYLRKHMEYVGQKIKARELEELNNDFWGQRLKEMVDDGFDKVKYAAQKKYPHLKMPPPIKVPMQVVQESEPYPFQESGFEKKVKGEASSPKKKPKPKPKTKTVETKTNRSIDLDE